MIFYWTVEITFRSLHWLVKIGFVSWFYVRLKLLNFRWITWVLFSVWWKRSLGFALVAVFGKLCVAWLKSTVEAMVRIPKAMVFIKSFRVGSKGLGFILILIEGFYGRSWLVCLVGGIPLTLGETSTPPTLPVKDLVFVCFSLAMMEFSDFNFEQGLKDLPLSEGHWRGAIIGTLPLGQELIRFLFFRNGEVKFPNLYQKRMHRLSFGHFPNLVDCGGSQGGKRPFEFENMSLKVEGFGGILTSFKVLLASFWLINLRLWKLILKT